jgi:PAS domain S-box-containing protein
MNSIDREGLFQLFMDSLPGAATLLDIDGNVLTWGAAARDITGYVADEIEGRNFSCLYTQDDIAAGKPEASLRRALAHGRHEETGRCVRKDGTVLEMHSVLMPLRDSKGELVGFGRLMREVANAICSVPEAVHTDAAPLQASETILVVDDDDQVREGVSHQLTSLGYKAVVASNGREALEILARESHIDLLFTDVVMPGLNGREVAEEGRLIRPNLKVLFTSGYFEGALQRNGSLDTNVHLLVKPYRKKRLAEKVLEVLRSTA